MRTFPHRFLLLVVLLGAASALAEESSKISPVQVAPADLEHFTDQPASIQKLLRHSLSLASQDLKYIYGSADPSLGGFDCSGAVNYLLRSAGFGDVPRQANLFYTWLADLNRIYPFTGEDPHALDVLAPGDLLFWTGTYPVDRSPPVTHVMIYLGRERSTGQHLMVGASSGHETGGFGVFPFHTGSLGGRGRFIAFGKLPVIAAK